MSDFGWSTEYRSDRQSLLLLLLLFQSLLVYSVSVRSRVVRPAVRSAISRDAIVDGFQ